MCMIAICCSQCVTTHVFRRLTSHTCFGSFAVVVFCCCCLVSCTAHQHIICHIAPKMHPKVWIRGRMRVMPDACWCECELLVPFSRIFMAWTRRRCPLPIAGNRCGKQDLQWAYSNPENPHEARFVSAARGNCKISLNTIKCHWMIQT